MVVMKSFQDDSGLSELLVSAKRVSKVTKGGRKFSFSDLIVVGDEKGRVGCGLGKHYEVAEAKIKAANSAKKKLIRVHLRENRTLHYDIVAKFCSGKVLLRSAKPGTGIIAGGAIRSVFEALGVKDIVAKSIGSTNPHNAVYAVFSAFNKMLSLRQIANKRGKKINEIIGKR
ncbi:30S ribosomal protein S5 [Candidatus Mesenet endosymbiont of Agriotes lineatus]|uniref:30S ribosomal protein S5 n=1 Tax=Candidatus Mesenet endosymbiont of Agriotes lineatus TaxID=3077948 RepID=UPI0030CEB2D1